MYGCHSLDVGFTGCFLIFNYCINSIIALSSWTIVVCDSGLKQWNKHSLQQESVKMVEKMLVRVLKMQQRQLQRAKWFRAKHSKGASYRTRWVSPVGA